MVPPDCLSDPEVTLSSLGGLLAAAGAGHAGTLSHGPVLPFGNDLFFSVDLEPAVYEPELAGKGSSESKNSSRALGHFPCHKPAFLLSFFNF